MNVRFCIDPETGAGVDSGDVDRPFFVVAHETAHQWWGGQVIPSGEGRGARLRDAGAVQFDDGARDHLWRADGAALLRLPHGRIPVAGGGYRVTLFADASKARADSIGNQTPVAMDDLVEVGAFAGPARDGSPGEALYLEQHRIRSGKQTIVITVPREAARAGVDPYRRLIERERDDNVAEVGANASDDRP